MASSQDDEDVEIHVWKAGACVVEIIDSEMGQFVGIRFGEGPGRAFAFSPAQAMDFAAVVISCAMPMLTAGDASSISEDHRAAMLAMLKQGKLDS